MPTNCSTTTTASQLPVRREVGAHQADQHQVSRGSCRVRTPSSTRSAIWSGVSAGAMPELGSAGAEGQAAQREGGRLGLDRELVGVRLEEPRSAARAGRAWALSTNCGGPIGLASARRARPRGTSRRGAGARPPSPPSSAASGRAPGRPRPRRARAGPGWHGRAIASSKASWPPAGLIASSAAASSSVSLSGKTRKIVPSAIPAASAISLVVTSPPCSTSSGISASRIALRRSSGDIGRGPWRCHAFEAK